MCIRDSLSTSLRSASVRNGPSEAFTGKTIPCAPLSTLKSMHFLSECQSMVRSSLNGVTGIAYTPRKFEVVVISSVSR